jgi:hypothetical protein
MLGTNISWEGNQISYKPNHQLNYGHYPDAVINAQNVVQTPYSGEDGIWRIRRTVNDHHEVMSFIARPRSPALGTAETSGFTNFNLKDDGLKYPFGTDRTEHSGQYQRPIQKTHKFFNMLPQRMNVGFNPLSDIQAGDAAQ